MRHRILLASAVCIAASVAVIRYLPSHLAIPNTVSASDLPARQGQHGDTSVPSGSDMGQSLSAVMSHPNVKRYLAREARKEALRDYFESVSGNQDKAPVWQLIDEIERDGGILAYEGLALKLAWLERHSESTEAFAKASEEVLGEYRARAEKSTGEYDPYKELPGFAHYKARERQIVAEVAGMEAFPGGVSRQQYLRQRLQEAREEAFAGE
ncbi:hypothetical protein ACNKU7_17090 [Microbulbifer sp. SA54]|uniref:hypothetical protein n=1 Tax=Microbulbifer sp. SA54 TaxID=3401577 RepID=UPI003AB0C126